MAGSPEGTFVGLSMEDLLAQKATALQRIANGDTTQLSGAGKSKGRQYSMSAADVLKEANYAIGLLTGGTIRQTHFDVTGRSCGYPRTIV